jgi:hypothetical protein
LLDGELERDMSGIDLRSLGGYSSSTPYCVSNPWSLVIAEGDSGNHGMEVIGQSSWWPSQSGRTDMYPGAKDGDIYLSRHSVDDNHATVPSRSRKANKARSR